MSTPLRAAHSHAACSSNASHMRRALSRFSAVSTSAVAPHATGSRASSSVSGNIDLTRSRSCSAAITVRFSACQRMHQIEQVGGGLGVDRVERLVEHDHARILQQQPREQRALHLPARERADRPLLEAGEADGRHRVAHLLALALADAAEQAGVAPQPHRDHVVDADRERAVDVGGLRQIGDVARAQAAQVDAAGERLEHADDALEQRRLAGAVRADHRHQRAGCDLAVQMMHRRMAVIAERQIAEGQRRAHDRHRPEDRAPQRGDQHRHAAEPLQRRQAQDRGRDRRGRVRVARMVVVMRLHAKCYIITQHSCPATALVHARATVTEI